MCVGDSSPCASVNFGDLKEIVDHIFSLKSSQCACVRVSSFKCEPSQTSQHLTCFTSASPSAPSQELNLERTCTCTRVELRMAAMARAMLGVCVYLCVCRVRTSHVPPRMNRSIQNLLQLYIPPKERFNGRPVFSRELLGTKMEARDMLMSAVLQTYEELLGNMLKQLSDPTAWTTGATATSGASASDRDPVPSVDARAELSYLLRRVQDLRKYRYQAQEKVLDGLGKLQHIQMDNLVVQSKALWELPWLYEEASALVESGRERRRRRRRQTLRRPQTVTSSTSNPN
ncbi:interferon gamma-like isoform X2 [Phyllopteryx taeniolatus]|uniref:interferon gamma-like isoform X2 n=1 Tax=Phyllopteryx taeniolatus TaxID=161469 RepID=UPI002AD40CA2|nr:interferon gamma-like isoform X2 [Phyllopteryx taeniolatus]